MNSSVGHEGKELTSADIKKLAGNRSALARMIAKRFHVRVGIAKQIVNDLLSAKEGRGVSPVVAKRTLKHSRRAAVPAPLERRRTVLAARVREWLIEAKITGRLAGESGTEADRDLPGGSGGTIRPRMHGMKRGNLKRRSTLGSRHDLKIDTPLKRAGLEGESGTEMERTGRLAGEIGTDADR